MIIGVNYHYIRSSFDDPHPSIFGVTPSELRDQLIELSRAGAFVSGRQILDALLNGANLPERALIITFDDGLKEQFQNAVPILMELDIPALFFVNTEPIERRTVLTVHKIHMLRAVLPPADLLELIKGNASVPEMTEADRSHAAFLYTYDHPETAKVKYTLNFLLPQEQRERLIDDCFREAWSKPEPEVATDLYLDRDQIVELGSLGWLGSHGHAHLAPGTLDRMSATKDIETSMDLLEQWSGVRPFAMSYPYGSFEACPAWIGAIAEKAGISFAFTMERGANAGLARPFHLARFDCNDVPGGKTSTFSTEDLFDSAPIATWPDDT